jgi:hypothetical protein
MLHVRAGLHGNSKCGVGSVLLVQADGRDLATPHAEALSHFCLYKIQPPEDSLGAVQLKRTREEVLEHINGENLEKYFLDTQKEKLWMIRNGLLQCLRSCD